MPFRHVRTLCESYAHTLHGYGAGLLFPFVLSAGVFGDTRDKRAQAKICSAPFVVFNLPRLLAGQVELAVL